MAQQFTDRPQVSHRRQRSTLPNYVIDVFDKETGVPLDLEVPSPPSAIVFTMRAEDGSLKVDREAAQILEVGADGTTKNRLRYIFVTADVTETGTFLCEFELAYAGSQIRTIPESPLMKLVQEIHDDLDGA